MVEILIVGGLTLLVAVVVFKALNIICGFAAEQDSEVETANDWTDENNQLL